MALYKYKYMRICICIFPLQQHQHLSFHPLPFERNFRESENQIQVEASWRGEFSARAQIAKGSVRMCGMALNERLCNCNGLRLDLTSLTLLIYNLTPPPLPSCRHIPKAKATAIADTPELKRIAENTKIQSNVKYHADFEKAKGKFTQVSAEKVKISLKNLYF